jgi:hypothetical protein
MAQAPVTMYGPLAVLVRVTSSAKTFAVGAPQPS